MCDFWTRTMVKLEHFLTVLFGKWGRFVARHPIIVIVVSFIFAGIFASFIPNMESETEGRYLWAPQGTISWDNTENYLDTWAKHDPELRYNNLIITSTANGDDDDNDNDGNQDKNVLTTSILNQALTIHNLILNITIKDEYTFNNFCTKDYSNNENCFIECVLEFYNFDESLISNIDLTSPSNIITYPVSYSPWAQEYVTLLTRFGSPTTFYGDDRFNYSYIVNGTPAFQCTYITDGDLWDEELLIEFEDEFINLLGDNLGMYISDDISVTYNAEKSFDDELSRSIVSDVSTFVASFVILSTFGTLLVLRFKKMDDNNSGNICKYTIYASRSRALVANFGVIAASLAIASCFGFAGGILGVKFNSIVSVSPFLLLGLGGMLCCMLYVFLCLSFIYCAFFLFGCLLSILYACNLNNSPLSVLCMALHWCNLFCFLHKHYVCMQYNCYYKI